MVEPDFFRSCLEVKPKRRQMLQEKIFISRQPLRIYRKMAIPIYGNMKKERILIITEIG